MTEELLRYETGISEEAIVREVAKRLRLADRAHAEGDREATRRRRRLLEELDPETRADAELVLLVILERCRLRARRRADETRAREPVHAVTCDLDEDCTCSAGEPREVQGAQPG